MVKQSNTGKKLRTENGNNFSRVTLVSKCQAVPVDKLEMYREKMGGLYGAVIRITWGADKVIC